MRLLGKLRASAPEPSFSNVLTPGRIPEFCIPPRLPVSCAPESWSRDAALPRRCAAEPDLWPGGADEGAGRTDWDPRSQAALSLPHLPRARTAYGFCALLETLALARLPPPAPRRPPLEAEGTVTLGRAGGALRLAAQYSPAGGRLRIRLLRAEGPAGGSAEPCAVGCRVSFVLQPPGKARQPRGAMVLRSRTAVLDQDFCLDGLSEDDVRRLAVRVKAEHKGHSPERGELHLGALLLP
ncbi:PREDICTED: C2 calcium-dependent domain-containing protein 4A-like [Condylura cristata]|uniref:C2 calcium-dependent domain-containing protein 4A-like n=1 Tax=Condylura cristata TaxID=143302 RepID=UPI0003347C4A|nr:PREDICTED: C2 calcium-dependent domain-containing protein 4A-like [Condylura cristata]